MPCGTSSVVSTRPATTSLGSHAGRYSRSMRTPAGPAIELGIFCPAASATATTIGVSHSTRFIGVGTCGGAKANNLTVTAPDPAAIRAVGHLYDRRVRTPSQNGPGRSDGRSAVMLAVAISAACWMVFAVLAIVVSASDTPS